MGIGGATNIPSIYWQKKRNMTENKSTWDK